MNQPKVLLLPSPQYQPPTAHQVPTIRQTRPNKPFPGKLEQIMEFPVETHLGAAPYKIQNVLIHEKKLVKCINVKPYDYTRLMVTFPDILDNFCPQATVEKCRSVLQDVLKLALYKGNHLQGQVLHSEGKCGTFDPVPLVEVNDLISNMSTFVSSFPQTAPATAETSAVTSPPAKRIRVE